MEGGRDREGEGGREGGRERERERERVGSEARRRRVFCFCFPFLREAGSVIARLHAGPLDFLRARFNLALQHFGLLLLFLGNCTRAAVTDRYRKRNQTKGRQLELRNENREYTDM